MQLSSRDFLAVALKPVLIAVAVALIVGSALGGFVAWKVTSNSHAAQENRSLRVDAQAWADIAKQQRQASVDQAIAFDTAVKKLNEISQGREDDKKAIQTLGQTLRADLAKLAAARPDLRDSDLGDDFLRHWNKAITEPAASTAAPGPAGEPETAVPSRPASDQRQPAGAAGAARHGSTDVPGLPQRQRPLDSSCNAMARNGVALVLPNSDWREPFRSRLLG